MKENSSACFLRAVNVGGSNLIKMADLTKLFRELGFSDVEAYLQSGNVIISFNEKLNEADLKSMIVTGIKKQFGLDISVVFRNKREIANILKGNLFLNNENADTGKLYVTMLETDPEKELVENLREADFMPERFCVSGRDIFLFMPDGYGRAKLNNGFFEKKLGSIATTRNWKTITALYLLLNKE